MRRVLLRMALRNLAGHRRKSITVGAIVASAAFIFMLGSSLLETAASGIRKEFRDRFTGDLYVTARSAKPISAFGWSDPGSMMESVPRLARHPEIERIIASLPGVESFASRAIGFTQLSSDSSEARGMTLLVGVDGESYGRTFPEALSADSGILLAPGQGGMMLSSFAASAMGDAAKAGSRLLVSTIGLASSIREVAVAGALRGDSANPMLDMVSYVDIDTLRGLMGWYAEARGEAGRSPEAAPPEAMDEAVLFGGDTVSSGAAGAGIDPATLFAPGSIGAPRTTDPEAWQYIVIKTSGEAATASVRSALERRLAAAGLEAQVHGWLEGAGMIASTVMTIKDIFYWISVVIAAVALLIIMNALVISVTERTGEIGTMRAIGGTRRFVTSLIVTETVLLSAVSGIAGIALACGCLGILSISGIPAPDMFTRIFFGGETLRPAVTFGGLALSLSSVLGIGILASWYPTRVALRVAPSTAMQRN